MPAARPRASFEPIPPDFDVRTFVETSENFQYVDRISYEMIESNGIDQFEKLVLLHVILGGKPLVIDGFEEALDPWTFTPSWLRDNHGDKVEHACNLSTKENIPLTIRHYIKHMNKLTDQFFDAPDRYRDKTRQRIYLKDIDCPQVWQDKLKEHIPPGLFYLNESTGDVGGPGALDEGGGRKGRGIARAGDLMSSLPAEMRAENLMCYIGHEGTYTPSHREMCASLGQNIMVDASKTVGEDGKPERSGSSLWFMTESKDRHVVSEYWLSILGHDIEVENHFAQLIAWKKAPFRTYVVEQRPGDFILIPPLAPHQVWNRGTRTMKIAWNRTTAETLEMAINEALPNSRIVCRDEQYKNKAIVYYTLQKYSSLLKSARAQVEMGGDNAEAIQRSIKVRQVQKDFKKLFDLYKSILLSEMFAPDSREHPEFLPYDSNSGYTWVEQWKWKDLIHKYDDWRAQIIDIDGHMTDKTPLPLQEERRYHGKKTVAQVCQEQLRLRPFVDVRNPQPESNSDDEEPVVDECGHVKKVANMKSKQWLSKHKSCHFCLHRHPKWKMAFCTDCDLAYCYGTLFRAHDLMPLSKPYEPRADVRSVECLVDFSVSNLNWLREEEGSGQNAMQRRLHQAELDKLADPSLDPRYIDEDIAYARDGIAFSPVEDANGDINENGDTHDLDAHNGVDLYYADPDANGDIPRLGQKRGRDDEDDEENKRRKKKAKKAKNKDDSAQPLQPKNISGQQYQKEVQRKLLEEAKRDDRLILVAARMKNKSKIVKLSLSTGKLECIRNRPVPERPQAVRQNTPDEIDGPSGMGSILQSDIRLRAGAQESIVEKEKAAKTFRYRVEEDTAYNSRKRNSDVGGPSKPGRPRGSRRYEEITVDSDEEFANEDDEVENTGRPHGRTSNWLARKNQGEEDMPTELPPDFRDGAARPNREKDIERAREYNERRKSLPAKPKANIRPVGRPPKNSTVASNGNVSDEDGIHEEDDLTSEALLLAQQAAAAALEAQKQEEAVQAERDRAAAAEREAQENLRAKMALFDGHDDDDGTNEVDEFLNRLTDREGDAPAVEDAPIEEAQPSPSPKPVRTGPPQTTNSIFSQPGMRGKKFKIVGAQSSRNGTAATTRTLTSFAASFTPVNRRAKEIDLSDSDSDDAIPAKAPVPVMKGKSAMVPTRGGGALRGRGRGRGRPRKTM
ncbi:hypothetical protein IQ06DRAFT_329287 [Phaeosphaeriaceae sp. SRC1lsM3a]|nr:hypothetical protein IQ06DRAFT_329287 [Stagonospora sp. SRC1lsM3a]